MKRASPQTKRIIRQPSPSTLHPSAAHAYKSMFYCENQYADATLKVDYDTNRNPLSLARVARVFASRAFSTALSRNMVAVSRAMVFKTGRGHHLRVWLTRLRNQPFPARTTLRLQAMLGDDPMRQRFNAARVRRGEKHWNVLWSMKSRNGKIVSREVVDEEMMDAICCVLW
jgi:hypothetical protein